MKKGIIIIVALVSALVGAASFYAVGRVDAIIFNYNTNTETQTRLVPSQQVKFTSSSSNEYPDLTYAAELTVENVVGVENIQLSRSRYQNNTIDPFLELFGYKMPQQQQGTEQEQVRSGGSGVIISEDGYIVTNNHVIDGADKIRIKLKDGTSYIAELIGTDPTTDIALLKIDAKGLSFSTFGSSEELRLGEWVVAVGNPYGLNSTITAGIVSAKSRSLDAIPSQFSIESYIQTDAAVNPGNSGGPLVNTKGEIIGINTLITSPTGSYTGYSFAVPSSIVKKIIVDFMEYGIVQRAILGVQYQEINNTFRERYAQELGVTEQNGLYVSDVVKGEAAEEAGIKRGDVIFEIDGVSVKSSPELREIMAKHRPNEKIVVGVKREGKVKHFDVVLRNMDGEAKLMDKDSRDSLADLGGEFQAISSQLMIKLNIEYGVQVTSISEGLLKECGITKGYIITHINGKQIESVSDLRGFSKGINLIDGLYPNGRNISYRVIEK